MYMELSTYPPGINIDNFMETFYVAVRRSQMNNRLFLPFLNRLTPNHILVWLLFFAHSLTLTLRRLRILLNFPNKLSDSGARANEHIGIQRILALGSYFHRFALFPMRSRFTLLTRCSLLQIFAALFLLWTINVCQRHNLNVGWQSTAKTYSTGSQTWARFSSWARERFFDQNFRLEWILFHCICIFMKIK